MTIRYPILIGASVALSGCGWVGLADKDYAHITQGDAHSKVHLVRDSPAVRVLIANHAAKTVKQSRLEGITVSRGEAAAVQARLAFLGLMKMQPGVEVPGNSYARLLETSLAGCNSGRHSGGTTYVRVRITSGSHSGEEGWACYMTDISPTFP
jgi:hypothetical protein